MPKYTLDNLKPNDFVLHEELDKFSKWICKLENGTGFICRDPLNEEIYFATACHVLFPKDTFKNKK
jgi:hypothetical protein